MVNMFGVMQEIFLLIFVAVICDIQSYTIQVFPTKSIFK